MNWLAIIAWTSIGPPQIDRPIEVRSLKACTDTISAIRAQKAAKGALASGACHELKRKEIK